MRGTIFILLFSAISLSTFAALDLNSPTWRGYDRTTYQSWDFGSDNLIPLPDEYDNQLGILAANVQPTSGTWIDELNGHSGIFPLSGHIYIPIRNFPEPLDQKIIWVQITWIPKEYDIPIVDATDNVDVFNGDFTKAADWTAGIPIQQVEIGQGWIHSTYEIVLRPNPAQETIHIYGAVYVDDVVIDTRCVPEPASFGLLAAGSVFLFVMRKRVVRDY